MEEAFFPAPPRGAYARRILHGIGLPFGVLRAILSDPALRRAYLRVLRVEVAAVFAVAFLLLAYADEIAGAVVGSGWRAGLDETVEVFGKLFVALCIAEWCVAFLAHEHNAALADGVAGVTRAGEREPPVARRPRIRADVAALWRSLEREAGEARAAARGAPFEALGIALARVACCVPVLYLATRPVFRVAASHALLGRRAADAPDDAAQ